MKIECYDDTTIFFKFNIESNLSDTGYIIDEIKIKHEFKNREIEILSVPIKFYKNKEFFEGKFEGKASYYDSYELLLGKGKSILLHKFKKNFEVHTEMFGGDKGYCFRDVEVNNTILDPTSLYIDHNTLKSF
jgi:hypothetical protein